MNSGEKLCLACGLCCDGTLFDNVQLGADENAKKLKTLGLPVAVTRGRVAVSYFRQPCTALCADRACRFYADRPEQCRAFECGVYKDVQASRIEETSALNLVKKARRKADYIRRLLRELGDADETRSLGDRFRRTQRRMEAGGGDAAAEAKFAELGLAVHQFNLLAHKKFYTKASAAS